VLKIELLNKQHDRAGFDCGSAPLNLYLAQTARQHTERGISRAFVLVDDQAPTKVLGFFTVNICQLQAESLPAEIAKKMLRQVAGLKLGRLAVAKARQKEGLGKLILADAMKKVLALFESAGGIGLFVDAKDAQAKKYYEQFGFRALANDPMQFFLPIETIQQARG
jgi:GNAT superfamily N-acetyltransferase